MATWASLTAEQKDIVLENDRQLRAAVGAYARALENIDSVKAHYDASASALVASLDAGEVIPHGSGLAGVVSSTETFYATVLSSLATTLANDNAAGDRQNYAKLAGPSNIG